MWRLPKMGVSRMFHYKPSILMHPHLRKPPCFIDQLDQRAPCCWSGPASAFKPQGCHGWHQISPKYGWFMTLFYYKFCSLTTQIRNKRGRILVWESWKEFKGGWPKNQGVPEVIRLKKEKYRGPPDIKKRWLKYSNYSGKNIILRGTCRVEVDNSFTFVHLCRPTRMHCFPRANEQKSTTLKQVLDEQQDH